MLIGDLEEIPFTFHFSSQDIIIQLIINLVVYDFT